MTKNALFAVTILALAPGWAKSEVADASANGFTVKISLRIQAAPGDVYARLIQHVGDWWNPEHTYSGNAHNLSIEGKAMGCFCEKLRGEGMVRHMEVVIVMPGKALSLTGALGPLQAIAATGNMKVQLTPADGGTSLDVIYSVLGYLPAGMNTWAEPVNSVLTEQFTRLKNYVERGDPAPK
jgi:uncharacterized protein YndB with AHSA1/START domain